MLTDSSILRLDQAPVTSLSLRDQDHSPLRRPLPQAPSRAVCRFYFRRPPDSIARAPRQNARLTTPSRFAPSSGVGAMNALRPHQLPRRARPRPPVLCGGAASAASVERWATSPAPGEQAGPSGRLLRRPGRAAARACAPVPRRRPPSPALALALAFSPFGKRRGPGQGPHRLRLVPRGAGAAAAATCARRRR